MKKYYIIITVLLVSALSLRAQDKGLGAGIMFGEPTGISAKGWINSVAAVDVGIAYSFLDVSSLHLSVDYVFHNYNLLSVSSGKLPFYYGIGGRLKFKNTKISDDTRIGARVPIGLCYQFQNSPVDIFLEIVPVLDLEPQTKMSINSSIGIRYFFTDKY